MSSTGYVDSDQLLSARVAFSLPVINVYPNPLSAGPVFASHPLDMQLSEITEKPSIGHVGPPTCNIEVKLLDVDEAALASGADPVGKVSA